MRLAKDLRGRVAAADHASLEFAPGGNRLPLNPIDDCVDALRFILRQEESGGPVPVASGRAVGDGPIGDRASGYDGDADDLAADDLAAVVGDLLRSEPMAQRGAARPSGGVLGRAAGGCLRYPGRLGSRLTVRGI